MSRPLLLIAALLFVACARRSGPIVPSAPRKAPAEAGTQAQARPAQAEQPGPSPAAQGKPPKATGPRESIPLTVKRLDFRRGEPHISVRLMERQSLVRFSPRGRMRARFEHPDRLLEAAPNSRWSARVTEGTPAVLAASVQLEEFPFADKAGLAAAQALWTGRGVKTRAHVLGALYGIAGKVIDNRRYLLLEATVLTPAEAALRQAAILREFGARTALHEEVKTPARGTVELLDEHGTVAGRAEDALVLETQEDAGFDVQRIEYGVGYDFHGFEDRSFRGALQLAVDRFGSLAVVNLVPLEEHLKGLVPSEIFARAPTEALKAQAVTARGEVLAKVGTKHLADPYLLCSEQHCAVYKGRSGEVASTNEAVEATRGQGLFSSDGRLVDSVYSAVCGGHTEDNDIVWGGPPNPNLRGKPDLLSPAPGLPTPASLERYLAAELPAACRLSTFAQPSKYRWERRFTAAQVDALTASLRIGHVQAMSVTERGVSGRARLFTLAGEEGATQVRGELNIRRLFGMLNSGMFQVSPERDSEGRITEWVFRGGGWGHGVGMCQTGAIGRAEAGHRYEDILRHYFSGASVAPIY